MLPHWSVKQIFRLCGLRLVDCRRRALASVVEDCVEEQASGASLDRLVEVEQLDIAARLAPLAVFTSCSVVQVLAWLNWSDATRQYLSALLPICVALAAISLLLTRAWRNAPKPDFVSQRRYWLTTLTALAAGVTLGTVPAMLFAGADMQNRGAIMATCAGLIATGMSLSATPRLAFAYAGPIVAGSFIGLASTGDFFYVAVAILLVVYAFFLSFLTTHLAALISRRVAGKIELERERALTAQLLQDFEADAEDWLWETDADFRLAHVSDRLAEAFGCDRRRLQGENFLDLLERHIVDSSRWAFTRLRDKIEANEAFRDAVLRVHVASGDRWWRIAGKPKFVAGDTVAGYRGVGADITEKQTAQERVSHLAMHDGLTDLPNRVQFQKIFDERVASLATGGVFAVMCLDLDEFKSVNDGFGHGVGDALLIQAADRMRRLLGPGDFLVRMAGDEFIVLRTGAAACDHAAIAAFGARLVAAIGKPFHLDGISAQVGVSIGVALAPQDGGREVLRRADLALYQSKRLGKGSLHFYHAEMDERVEARRLLAADLRNAIADDEFHLVFQPLVHAATREIQGFEALLRWRHRTRGVVSPAEFIPLAEETGAIIAIGEWVLREACRLAARWPRQIKLAVNVSPAQIRYCDLTKIVGNALADSGFEPHRLELELTESAFLENSQQTEATLNGLRGLGVRLSLDDFGTGYSSLSYLRNIPFDKVKIDRSFVRELPADERDLAIVRAIVDIASTMGMSITAEGIETEAQARALLALGCHQFQGYLFSRPVSAADALHLTGATPRRLGRQSAA
jgi:diguanylate cyclase (GGDEF)-like protein/PAS domain S-box-containing protein